MSSWVVVMSAGTETTTGWVIDPSSGDCGDVAVGRY